MSAKQATKQAARQGSGVQPNKALAAMALQNMTPPMYSNTSTPKKPTTSASRAASHKRVSSVKESQERKEIQNVARPDNKDRHNVELVGRKDSDPKTAKEKTSSVFH